MCSSTVTNIGNADLQLNNDEGQPWLGFMVMGESVQHNFMPVHSERQSNFAPLALKVGETKTLRVNITPLYNHARGGQLPRVRRRRPARRGPGRVGPGAVHDRARPCRRQRHADGVDTLERDYSLVRFSPNAQDTSLYLRVEAPSENTVYSNYALGPLVSSVDPTLLFDPQGNVHVLQPMSQGTYLYTRTDQDGKLLAQRLFKSTVAVDGSGMRVRPQLIKINDGSVFVSGGIEENPNAPHEKLSDTQHGEPIMAPTAPDDSAPQSPPAVPSTPPSADSAAPPVGDPGTAAQAAPANNPSSTDMPPAGR